MSANGALTTHPSPLDKGKSNDLDVHQEENEYTVTHSHFGENEWMNEWMNYGYHNMDES